MEQSSRPETGPMKFGDDWTGLFIRGDNAMYYGVVLENVLSDITAGRKTNIIYLSILDSLKSDLFSAREGFDLKPQRAMLVTDGPVKA